MGSVQINEDLLSDSAYFAAASRRAALAEMFEFRDRRVVFGAGALSQLADECVRLGAGRVLLIHDPGIAPLVDLVRQALSSLDLVGTYSEIAPNPSVQSVDACAQALAATDFDVAVALGGGQHHGHGQIRALHRCKWRLRGRLLWLRPVRKTAAGPTRRHPDHRGHGQRGQPSGRNRRRNRQEGRVQQTIYSPRPRWWTRVCTKTCRRY